MRDPVGNQFVEAFVKLNVSGFVFFSFHIFFLWPGRRGISFQRAALRQVDDLRFQDSEFTGQGRRFRDPTQRDRFHASINDPHAQFQFPFQIRSAVS